MNDEFKNKQGSNWLISFSFLIAAFTLSLTLYLLFSAASGDFNPLNWAKRDITFYLMTAFSIIFPCALNYITTQYEIDIEGSIEKIFDYHEFKSKKYLDALLSHYGNVATTGLFLMGLIYIIRNHSDSIISPIYLAAFSVVIFFIYSLYILKLAMGMTKYGKYIYFSTVVIAITFDMQIIEMFIISVPKP